jgi:hypothetical protein
MAKDNHAAVSNKAIPTTPRAQAGRSLNALLKYTPPYVKNRARDEHIIIKKLKYSFTKGGARAVNAVLVNMTTTAPDVHEVSIIGLDGKVEKGATNIEKIGLKRLYNQKRLQVDCDCGFFVFTCEYALWTWGAAKIKRCNGEPAVVKNPQNVPLVCKHLVVLLRAIKEKGF